MNQNRKAWQCEAFRDKISIGVLSTPVKLFNTPILIQLSPEGDTGFSDFHAVEHKFTVVFF